MIHGDNIIYADPYSGVCDFSDLPKAGLILISNHHHEHFDTNALQCILTDDTMVISNEEVAEKFNRAEVLANGECTRWKDVRICCVPAYNTGNEGRPGVFNNAKGICNGYIVELNDLRVYIAGDTGLIPEMESFGKIDIAFLPQREPLAMDEDAFIEAVGMLRPRILYPYHCDDIDKKELQKLLSEIQVR